MSISKKTNANGKLEFTYTNDDCDDVTVEVPAKFDVCPRCEGRGSHVNPAIDGHGLTREDFDADPDFEEAYFEGRYDVTCQECDGLRVVSVVDWDKTPSEMVEQIENQMREDARYARECRAAERYGY